MDFDSRLRDGEFARNLLVGLTPRQEGEDIPLAVRQADNLRAAGLGRDPPPPRGPG